MKLAVAIEGNQVHQHFGQCTTFAIYEVEGNEVKGKESIDLTGLGHDHNAVAEVLSKMNVRAVFCGGIGGGARIALQLYNIAILGGVQGDADEVMDAYIAGTLLATGGSCAGGCSHHHGEEACGGAGCGHHEGGCCGH